jgi:transcription-repair coupling factor (superfamily II helicase)
VLVRFIRREVDVLVCTAIVESGVDLPNVNTMIIDLADRFGLAQLYQLRGRVGRAASVRGHCLLLAPEEMTREARRRLQVLVENTDLGAGFRIAMADLELRGAGNLLGESQSGNIDAVGYEVWLDLLRETMDEVRGAHARRQIEPEVEVPVDAFIPDAMVPDLHERLGWYKRLSTATTEAAVERAIEALEAEHGEIPVEVQNLAGFVTTRVLCRDLGILRCTWLKVRVLFELHESHAIPPARLAAAVARWPKRMSLSAGVLEVRFTPREAEQPFRFLRWVLAQLQRD